MKATIKERLAQKLEELFGEEWACYPEDLRRNYGNMKYMDIFRWEGYVSHKRFKMKKPIGSYSTMKDLLKQKSISFVGDDKFEIS